MGTAKKTLDISEHTKINIIAAWSDGKRLLFICDQLLDGDIQPTSDDFTARHDDLVYRAKAVHLKSPIERGSSWSLITLLLDQAPPKSLESITINYQPEQWFMWSQVSDKSVAPFATNSELLDINSEHGFSAPRPGLQEQEDDAVPEPELETRVEAKVVHAAEHRVQLSFDTPLDISVQPLMEGFRAETTSRWLGITLIRFKPTRGDDGPTLWFDLADSLEDGEQVSISYKSRAGNLLTAGGKIVSSFLASDKVAQSESIAGEQSKSVVSILRNAQVSKPVGEPAGEQVEFRKPAMMVRKSYDELSETDRNIADLLGIGCADPKARPVNRGQEETISEPAPQAQERRDKKSVQVKSATESKSAVAKPPEKLKPLEAFDDEFEDSDWQDDESRPFNIAWIASWVKGGLKAKAERKDQVDRVKGIKRILTLLGLAIVGWLAIVCIFFVMNLVRSESSSNMPVVQENVNKKQTCSMDYPGGGRYQGHCASGKRSGEGIYTWSTGDKYQGTWEFDKRHGKGTMSFADGKRIGGIWKNDKLVGKVNIVWPNGVQYVGQVRENNPHGKGVMTYTNGDRYDGSFENNLKHGKGIMIWASGAKYEGEYVRGRFHGRGTFWSPSGTRYEGVFRNGSSTQNGVCYQVNGESKKGPCSR